MLKLHYITTILSDSRKLARVCGLGVAARWLWAVVGSFGECRRAGSLQPADRRLGKGPFRCRLRSATAALVGDGIISGIREIWCRDVYLSGGLLKINDGDTVVDLGCNAGTFSMLALGSGPNVRVVAVEPLTDNLAKVSRQLESNGWTSRMQICQGFVGGHTPVQDDIEAEERTSKPRFLDEDSIVQRFGLSRIDFLKCDIEGSEFDLLTPKSKLLAMTRQLAIEVHDFGGDRARFIQQLKDCGFDVWPARLSANDGVYGARRVAAAA